MTEQLNDTYISGLCFHCREPCSPGMLLHVECAIYRHKKLLADKEEQRAIDRAYAKYLKSIPREL